MEKNELSRIPDPDDPVMPTDNANLNRGNILGSASASAQLNTFNAREYTGVNIIEGGNKTDLESSSGKHEQHQPNDTMINIHGPVNHCCIYKVPIFLRKINEEAYTPQVISIGPIHHGKKALSEMEKQKTKYISEFKERKGAAEMLEDFKSFIRENEQLISNYYHELSYDKKRFVNMIFRDAVFIIMFFLKNEQHERKSDPYLDTPAWKVRITSDLQLLENQLPYFVLKNLFEKSRAFHNITKEDPHHEPFLNLSHRFFFGDFPKPNNKIQQCEIQHFTDLIRNFLLMDILPRDGMQREHVRDLPTATMLHESGVKFSSKGIEGRSSLDEISCERATRAQFITKLNVQIPCFKIDDRTECLYRNIMALEQFHYHNNTHICNLILLMNFLINTKEDVDLLVCQGIISISRLGNNAAIQMFNNLCLQITPSPSVYHNLAETLKTHYDRHRSARHWNRNMATLSREYFKDVWKGTATVAAFILLVLTLIQAVCSILSLVLVAN